ncbi:MAG: ATP-binding protein [Oxalicibacterium faecigallinarum]|uniref:histidine kinase n=1 Tax=Oxalicibacterium faecigallinarum TaxID=573741 RepID=A0A8J3AM21_9BURK|nr:sensor histidine kinase [Oxalicibacterium faecigallinarum]MDQ7969712.1 ATP-binding protein [Oxalicibacterium faecigallinarum]GGI16300.1 two-component sensor histidine kinase [Oxalicibacterium faecigallinarum]
MRPPSPRLSWISSGLFWRTFILLASLIAISMAAWVASFRIIEQTPRANQIGAQIISIVTITRAALTHSAPDLRRELLFDLASNEGVRIYPLEENDQVEPPTNSSMMQAIQEYVRAGLGAETRFARNVNDVAGFWVSFAISDDEYWLMLDRDRIEGTSGIQWVSWGAVTLLLSLLGAMLISGLINQPLARIAAAAKAVANGRHTTPLPEKGPAEIRETNRSFNHMVEDLERVESDRALVLAGISHDLRTPLARMQLEVELAGLPDDARKGMQSDLEQMDAIIGQFLDYAKPTDNKTFEAIDLSALLQQSVMEVERLADVDITATIADNLTIAGNPIEIKRVLNNLVENARRYGKKDPSQSVKIDLLCHADGDKVMLEFGDHGNGVPDEEIARLLRPFTRMDQARGQANGAGLGLAIVDRIIKRHGGRLLLSNRDTGGLIVRIALPPPKIK